MRLHDFGMIAADTSRSRAYLQSLLHHRLLPNFVLLLEHESDSLLPGQTQSFESGPALVPTREADECWSEASFNSTEPLRPLLEEFDIEYETAPSSDLNDASVVNLIDRRPESVFIYSGFGGVLLRQDILATDKNFLHVHGGYLPDYKGSTTNYYSLIEENTMGASSIFLNSVIDSGPVLLRKKFPAPSDRREIDHVYDSAARAKVLVETLQQYLADGRWDFELATNDGGETYFIIHPVLKHIAMLDKGHQI